MYNIKDKKTWSYFPPSNHAGAFYLERRTRCASNGVLDKDDRVLVFPVFCNTLSTWFSSCFVLHRRNFAWVIFIFSRDICIHQKRNDKYPPKRPNKLFPPPSSMNGHSAITTCQENICIIQLKRRRRRNQSNVHWWQSTPSTSHDFVRPPAI